jgi:hypothetical protein
MSTQMILKVLALRHRLRQRDRWTRRRLEEHQGRAGLRGRYPDLLASAGTRAQGVIVPPVKVRRVPNIPRPTVGKAPLIKSHVPGSRRKP